MPIIRARKKPVDVAALRWTGENLEEMQAFVGPEPVTHEAGFRTFDTAPQPRGHVWAKLERGWIPCPVGHWVIRGVAGEFYPCDPDVFAETYEVLE